jgi:hypothetical protein
MKQSIWEDIMDQSLFDEVFDQLLQIAVFTLGSMTSFCGMVLVYIA